MFFKSLDQKITDLGFKEIKNDKYGIVYERDNGCYIHRVALLHKTFGLYVLQSYDPSLYDSKRIGNTCVGLTHKELTLFAKKVKQLSLV